MSRGPDAGTALTRAITADAGRHGLAIDLPASAATRWASATFTGARHELTVQSAASKEAAQWLDTLPEAELKLFGHLVADLTVTRRSIAGERLTAVIEALTVETR